ncbi:GntR family transcriptional regulator [Asticcacaulis sp. SL142]|uniref:GntR family transcriptional regulator n=1 Tax=Asticcacaulis sp. SL142 TaxID=2995155 RepID=UPI00226C8493|nr:GntR family transcriptional regulator [Asticcacaulis sp. SL142]WAC48118.1 GntR family transcriptional regulator [Asticcacaulis sp. SL142]
MGIHVQTVSEQVYKLLRDRLVSGTLSPHDAIRQEAIAAELGVSKIPVREALIRLQNEGLVVLEANRGFFVSPLSLEEAEDAYGLRLTMEPQAAALAAMRATPEDRLAVTAALNGLQHAAESDRGDVGRCNRLFHLSLIQPVRKPVTINFIERLHLISERNVCEHLVAAGSEDRAHQEHLVMYDAWMSGKGDEVARLVYDHINATFEELKAHY